VVLAGFVRSNFVEILMQVFCLFGILAAAFFGSLGWIFVFVILFELSGGHAKGR